MAKDLQIIATELKKIFKKKKYFEYFEKNNMHGWEKWLQIELATALDKRGISQIEAPKKYHMGKLKPLSKVRFKKCFVDVVFRIRNAQIKSQGAIELKVTNSASGLRAALSDLIKIGAIKQNEWDFRSVTAILIFQEHQRDTKFEKIKKHLLAHDLLVKESLTTSILRIPNTGYQALLINWDKNLTKDMTVFSYRDWVRNVRQIFEEHGVTPKLDSNKNSTN